MTFQAKLITKLESYAIDNTIVELKRDADKEQLNSIVKKVLRQLNKVDLAQLNNTTFEFLVGNRILQLSIEKHLELYSDEIDTEAILNEKLVEIEYFLSVKPPEPLDALPHDDWVSCVDADDSFILTGSYDNSVRIFSIKDRKNIVTIQDAHDKPITQVKWVSCSEASNDEKLFVTCGHDAVSVLRKFNTKSLKVQVELVYRGHSRSVNSIDSADDLIATVSFDKTLKVWSANLSSHDSDKPNSEEKWGRQDNSDPTPFDRFAVMTCTGHKESITGVRWMKDSNQPNCLVTCSMDRTICIWDMEVGEVKRKFLSAKPLLGVDYCKSLNLIVAASCDRHVRVWDSRAPDNSAAKSAYTSHSGWVSSVAFGQDSNNFVSGGYDNLVKLWDIRSQRACLYDLFGHHDKVLNVNWTNPSYVLSGSADATLKMFVTK